MVRPIRYHVPINVDRQTDRRRWPDVLAASLLFLATAGVVLWQNSRLAVLWDLSYILENGWRISLGQMPYRDFPLPYPPLTFLAQAALIKFTGRIYFHHVIYAAVAGGIATLLTWRILLYLAPPARSPRLLAFLLSAPLVVLGIYCIFPHPFYDCDCTFAVLVCLLLLLHVEKKGFSAGLSFVAGIVLVVPALVKQNTGLAFLGSTVVAIVVLMAIATRRTESVRGYAFILAGTAVGLGLSAILLHFTAGLENYRHWTVQFAAARRMPSFRDMLSVYDNRLLLWWLPSFAAGALLLSRVRASRWLGVLAGVLLVLPFAWTAAYLLIQTDSSDQAECLLSLWPFVLIVSFVLSLREVRRRQGMALVVPFIVIATVHGAFLSQQLWGSTYAIWPLAIVLIAGVITARATSPMQYHVVELMLPLAVAVSLFISGGNYIWSHERLDYANVADGGVEHSQLPALRELSVRGPWLPQFDELVAYANANIPAQDALLIIPGEDLFYYATGRVPRFPVLMFDHTVNPYSPEEVVEMARARNVRWLVVKRDLQLAANPVEDRQRLLWLALQDFTKTEELDNYTIYQRSPAAH
ncbi:MAG TPA: hypothetical protein VF840_12890 [Terriglobales bacterium]